LPPDVRKGSALPFIVILDLLRLRLSVVLRGAASQ